MQYKSYLIEQNISNLDKNIVLFYGENLGLKNDLKEKIKENNDNCEIIRFNQDEIIKNKNLLLNEISNISLFGKKKIFYIFGVSDKFLEIITDLEESVSESKIYLFSDILDKKSKIRNYFEKSSKIASVPCYEDNVISLKRIIQDKLKGFQGLTTQNINLILDSCNLDRIKLNNELQKISIFFENKKINTIKLELLLDTKINDNFNILKDEALAGNKIKTNNLLSETIIDTDKNYFYLSLLNQRLFKLKEIHNMRGNTLERKIDEIKPPIFWKDRNNFLIQARKWDSNKLEDLLKQTYKLELKIKSDSSINKNILIKNLIVEICKSASF